MANSLLTPDTIAAEALIQLENNLVMGNLVYRDYEKEFTTGEAKGATVSIRRPVQFTIRSGATASMQDVTEGKTSITVDQQKGVDFQFSSVDLTLSIEKFSERYVKPAMIQIANQIDLDLMTTAYRGLWNWVGTPGQTINAFTDFIKAPERLDFGAVPKDRRVAVLSPADQWALVGGFANGANFFQPDVTKTALEKAKLPLLGGVDAYMSQNVVAHTVGAHGGTPLVRGAANSTTYAASKDTGTMSLSTDGWSTSVVLKAGDVITIADVYAVNPVSKATLSHLQQFVLTANVTTNASSSADSPLTISPPIITSGAYQTVSAIPADDAAITYLGTASTAYNQNLVFHPNAFALACVPMELPEGAAKKSRMTKNGLSVRLVGDYDITNDLNMWRFDVLYGTKTLDGRLGTRLSGTA